MVAIYVSRPNRLGPETAMGQAMTQENALSHAEVIAAERMARRNGVPLSTILMTEFDVSALTIARLQSMLFQSEYIDPVDLPNDPALTGHLGPAWCLQHGLMPWRQISGTTIVLAAEPEQFDKQRGHLADVFGDVRMAITTSAKIDRTITRQFGRILAGHAERRTPIGYSCRGWNSSRALYGALFAVIMLALAAQRSPALVFNLLCALAIGILVINSLLKCCAAWYGAAPTQLENGAVSPARLPLITLLIPLYREREIAGHLLARLKALDYPHSLLDVCLVLEEDDTTTRDTLGRTVLPTWIRAVLVPEGTIRTKPRALNYALDFAKGSIIGVYDAEDAPAPDQLRIVARTFAARDAKTACLQGVLDYYNSSANWLTRCFTIEYASWFRVVLPGLSRMGLVVPLGGTTLFFRRDALEALGGWDAHNVTEDADLGVRLARHGFVTELIATTTEEEANGRFWPWVKQRSRWLKGYAITYAVHMRNPRQLWRDLGPWRFFGVQMLFAGTLAQFLLAPVLWSFWLLPLGYAHPLQSILPAWGFWGLATVFVLSEVVNLAVSAIALRKADKRWLFRWAFTLHFYFPLAAVAAYKGLLELAWRPFYWDKTAHGVLMPKQPSAPPQPPAHQA